MQDFISVLQQPENISTLTEIGRGIEREALRVLPEGKLSEAAHYHQLGSALTHSQITTDYSEILLEFITPVSHSPEESLAQLQDIQKFVLSEIDDELLWPMSMPCFVDDADKIPLAQYGNSNIGKMKTTYRQGLKNRYGSMMQVIAGIHFNFSFPQRFWSILQKAENDQQVLDDYISQKYFSLIRNYKRFAWLIPYLFGSSPAICPSFLQGRETSLPFKSSPHHCLYLEYATSLRMSDLGYTNSEQASLYICYNDIDSYVGQVQKAISLSSDEFAKIGIKVDGEYQQLNSNVLQIENELYASIRPKRVAKNNEKPSEALKKRGVEYIEIRALDVNPFSDTGISLNQILFLDIFLTYCALLPSPKLKVEQQQQFDENFKEVVLRGRDPQLMLHDGGMQKSITTWGKEIFSELKAIAVLLDQANESTKYQQALHVEFEKILDVTKTPSAQLLASTIDSDISLTQHALSLASEYRQQQLNNDYQVYNQSYFHEQAEQSHQAQLAVEQADIKSFDEFLADYFTGVNVS